MPKQVYVKCDGPDGCDGEGRWFDASHGCTRRCKRCDGKGTIPLPEISNPQYEERQTE